MGSKNDKLHECTKEEVDTMLTVATEYNEKIFLAELEESLKELEEKKNIQDSKTAQSSWRDLFNVDEE